MVTHWRLPPSDVMTTVMMGFFLFSLPQLLGSLWFLSLWVLISKKKEPLCPVTDAQRPESEAASSSSSSSSCCL